MDRHTTTSLLPGRPSLWVTFILAAVVIVLLLLATDVIGVDPPATGDWDVTEDTTIFDTDIVLTGNLTVHDGATLDLSLLYLRMNLTAHGQYNILVKEGGNLELDRVRIDSVDRSSRFNLTIEGSADIDNRTFIQRMDGPATPSPLSNPQGLVILSSTVRINGSYIQDCGGFAMTIEPGGSGTVTPTISDCYFSRNGGGIYVGGVLISSAEPLITGCEFYNNNVADIAVVAADPTITGCTFGGSITRTTIIGIAILALAEPVISDCTFSFGAVAITSAFADPIVRDCRITEFVSGIVVMGNDPLFERVSMNNVAVPVNLTGTTATLKDMVMTGIITGHSVTIDGGGPRLTRLLVDPGLFGTGVRIFNDSRAVVRDSTFYDTGANSVVLVEDSVPLIENCTIGGGGTGVELRWSPATIEGCTITNNDGWGILSYFEAFTGRSNDFGAGDDVNADGRVIQYYRVEVFVEHEDGGPAVDATVSLTNALDVLVDEVATDDKGLAFDDVYIDFFVTNANRTVVHAPYLAEATLGELANSTTFQISDNPRIVIVLGPLVDLPPAVAMLSPVDGGEYDVWELGNRIPFEGSVVDPEGGQVSWAWHVDGEMVNDLDLTFRLELLPGSHEVALMGADEGGQEAWVYHNISVVSIPPGDNYVGITSPEEGAAFDMGEAIDLACEYYVLDHPELEAPVPLRVTWTSDIDELLLEEEGGELANLTPGEHVLTVTVWPRYPQFIGDPYTDSVVIEVLPPAPVAVAVISSPDDGTEFRWDATVHLAANGSHLDIWDPPEYRTIYRWFSDIDGILGEGKELDARHLVTGVHNITLLLTTDPFLVSNETTVTIVMHPEPNHPPVARISVLMDNHTAGEPVLMTASLSADTDGDPLAFSWDLGDGNTSTAVDVNHTYEMAGNYTITLTVSDGALEDVDTIKVQVLPADDGGNGGDGGDDSSTVEPSDTWLGWLFIILLFVALGAMLFLWYWGRERTD